MSRSVLVFLGLLVLVAFSRNVAVAQVPCNDCTSCSAALSVENAVVTLSQDILNHAGDCITVNAPGVTFDCQDKLVQGNGTSPGANGILNNGNDDVTIKNCRVEQFSNGIVLESALANELSDNVVKQCNRCVILSNTNAGTVSRTAVSTCNNEGIFLEDCTNTQLMANEACNNHELDIRALNGSDNTGTDNTCDNGSGWLENGATAGCTFACSVCDDYDGDGICDIDDNCEFDSNTDQGDKDNDSIGDVCDNCPDVANKNQANSDFVGDHGDACDNCWSKVNPDQNDDDGDCQLRKQDATFWDGTQWLKDPHCGNQCDNCPANSNPDQADKDFDGRGDTCDNCPDDSNSNQDDFDNDGYGDACDNCWKRSNADQSNQDGDILGDVCDNCWTAKNDDQSDRDHDCNNLLPPFSWDPHCGDACDNCPDDYNRLQEDWDGDDQGDACDCDDKLMGENEKGADCGGICGAACPADCVPILLHGDPKGKIDILFIPASLDYHNKLDDFRNAAREDAIFGAFFDDPLLKAHKERFNFWYTTKEMPFSKNVNNDECVWQEPPGFRASACPGFNPGDTVAVVLHTTKCRDFANVNIFSARNDCRRTFVHEFGHAGLELRDEYDDCDTDYSPCSGQYCNIYTSEAECKAESLNPSGCAKFTDCVPGGRWKSQPTYSIMAKECGPTNSCGLCPWGDDGERAALEKLAKWVDPPADEFRKVFVGYFRYDGTGISLVDIAIVRGEAPERFAVWDALGFDVIDAAGVRVHHYTLSDPRRIEYFEPLETDIRDEVVFAAIWPFIDNLTTLEVNDLQSATPPASFDLVKTVLEYCGGHLEDPQCSGYDSDADGAPDIGSDNCVGIPNPGQEDGDQDGIGDACEVTVTLCKVEDIDADLATTGDRIPVAGRLLALTADGTVVDTRTTGAGGCVTWTDLNPGPAYGVHEDPVPGWFNLSPADVGFGPSNPADTFSHTFVNAQEADVQIFWSALLEDRSGERWITYTLTVTNNGPGTATGVEVTDRLPPAVAYRGDTCGAVNLPPWTWRIGSLPRGTARTCDISGIVSPDFRGRLTNRATVVSDHDAVADNDTWVAEVAIGPIPVPTLSTVGALLLLAMLACAAAIGLQKRRRSR